MIGDRKEVVAAQCCHSADDSSIRNEEKVDPATNHLVIRRVRTIAKIGY
jgi:hypothetical protein